MRSHAFNIEAFNIYARLELFQGDENSKSKHFNKKKKKKWTKLQRKLDKAEITIFLYESKWKWKGRKMKCLNFWKIFYLFSHLCITKTLSLTGKFSGTARSHWGQVFKNHFLKKVYTLAYFLVFVDLKGNAVNVVLNVVVSCQILQRVYFFYLIFFSFLEKKIFVKKRSLCEIPIWFRTYDFKKKKRKKSHLRTFLFGMRRVLRSFYEIIFQFLFSLYIS